MAFQHREPFFSFLKHSAKSPELEVAAPAQNFILDERLPLERENDFLDLNDFDKKEFHRERWFKQHKDYSLLRLAHRPISDTFSGINKSNWLRFDPDWDVIRIETVSGLVGRANRICSEVDETKAVELITKMLESRGKEEDPAFEQANAQEKLEGWLSKVNEGSDSRPAFVAPFAEVEQLIEAPDWPDRIRDALGLGHIKPWNGNPVTVVLLQYNLEKVYQEYLSDPAWAASPTVLDEVPGQLPSSCFFPAPRAEPDGFGFTVDLAKTGATYRREFVHAPIPYEIDYIKKIGDVTTDVLPERIAQARERHKNLLASDLANIGDLQR